MAGPNGQVNRKRLSKQAQGKDRPGRGSSPRTPALEIKMPDGKSEYIYAAKPWVGRGCIGPQ